jgi:hypothetical protein
VKLISAPLKSHLAHPVTTLTTCWHVIRTDGAQYAFTSFDSDLLVDGINYSSTAGFTRSAIQTGSAGQVDNVDLVGFFAEDAITERDLKNGLFDYASIYLFCVNWADLSQGICRLRRGWIGECTRTPAGIFHAELRGLTQALVQEFGFEYMPICRADLGDNLCRVPIKPAAWQPGVTVSKGDVRQASTRDTDDLLVAIFEAQNAGTTGTTEPAWSTAIGSTTSDNGISWLSKPYWRGIGTVTGLIDHKAFISSPLSVPAIDGGSVSVLATTADMFFVDRVSSGTSILVSDGIQTHALTGTEEVDATTAWRFVFQFFFAFNGSWGITTTGSGTAIYFTNASGVPGTVSKTGDTQRGVTIRNFETLPFDGGALTWISGNNSGRTMEIKFYDGPTSKLSMWLGMYFPIQVGDRFMFYPGCDKRRDTCFFIYNNILNFRGEPDMPMFDMVLSYPDA